jgi:uncharacterized SAM-binding protein YcdF (DUF218 family)
MIFSRQEESDHYLSERDGISIIEPPRFLPHFVIVLTLFVAAMVAVHFFGGRNSLQGVLMSLATPLGVIWLLLILAGYWVTAWRVKLAMLLVWGTWLALTLAGSSYFSNWLITSLERPYLNSNPFAIEKLDVAIVLGGGTDTTPAGVPQLALVGDRLALAARMYHAGKVDTIIVTGLRRGALAPNEMELYDESKNILVGLKVPEANIVPLKLGKDTSEEIQGLKQWLSDKEPLRVGVVTSAWHMPRTMMLARRHQATVIPVPANFLSEPLRPGPGMLIPNGLCLLTTQLGVKEYLGLWFDQ